VVSLATAARSPSFRPRVSHPRKAIIKYKFEKNYFENGCSDAPFNAENPPPTPVFGY
jgi:hypothetical protein